MVTVLYFTSHACILLIWVKWNTFVLQEMRWHSREAAGSFPFAFLKGLFMFSLRPGDIDQGQRCDIQLPWVEFWLNKEPLSFFPVLFSKHTVCTLNAAGYKGRGHRKQTPLLWTPRQSGCRKMNKEAPSGCCNQCFSNIQLNHFILVSFCSTE